MIDYYTIDAQHIYIGAVQIDPYGPLPHGTTTPPPDTTGDEVVLWTGVDWVVLPERPPLPEPAPPAVPPSVTMRQARLALLGAGLLASVDAAIDSLPSPQKEAARIEWEYATEVQRSSGLVPMMAAALGLDDAALDALFIGAEGL